MPTINIRGISQAVYNQCCQLAETDGVSLNAEVRMIFEEGVRQRMMRRSREEALRIADENRARVGGLPINSLELLHEGREQR